MTTIERIPRIAALLLAGGLLLTQTGCGIFGSAVELRSFKDPFFPESYHLTFNDCVFRTDSVGDVHVLARTAQASGATGGAALTQTLYVQVYWRPHPGKTFADSSAADATFRYTVASSSGAAIYAGTGFVYPRDKKGDHRELAIENACLRLVSQVGDVPDVLGEVRLTGVLHARHNAAHAAALAREAELLAAK